MASPNEVSEQLNIPPATLRRYVSLFGDHLSEGARRARGREFSEGDLEVLGGIRSLFEAGSSTDEVRERLGGPPVGEAQQMEGRQTTAPALPEAAAPQPPPETAPPAAESAGADADAEEYNDDLEALDRQARKRQLLRVQPVRASLEVRKMAGEPGAADHLSQRLALVEDRLMTSNERVAVLEARITRLEEWVKMPWYRRVFSRPPVYDL